MLKIGVSWAFSLAKNLFLEHQPTVYTILILVFAKQISSGPLKYSRCHEFGSL